MSNIDKNNKVIIEKITCKTYIIDNLKIKIFININIIKLKEINVLISFNQIIIDNYQLIIFTKLQTS